jgi:hypothetical protein
VCVVRGVHDLGRTDRVEDVGQDVLLGLAGEGDLLALDDLGWPALAVRPLRPQLLEVLVKPLGPERDPAAAALHERHLQPREAVEDPLADHVHQRDHQLEGECCHVNVAVLLHALGAGAHHAVHPILPVVAGLRVDRQRHADLLGGGVDRVEAPVAQVDAVDVVGQHGGDDAVRG